MIEKILKQRGDILGIFVIAILAGTGINLISYSITENSNTYLLLAITLLLVSILFFILPLMKLKTSRHSISGFIVFDEENNRLISIKGYDYSEQISLRMASAIKENKDIEMMWRKEPMDTGRDEDHNYKNPSSHELIRQITEYYFLKKLSECLNFYFFDEKIKNIKKYRREDIPEIITQNYFLDLFSKPIKERSAFENKGRGEKKDSTTYAAFVDGYNYERFELIFPHESKLNRDQKGNYVIETPLFKMVFSVLFEGTNAYLPSEFADLFIGTDSSYIYYYIRIDIKIELKLISFFTFSGWEYFKWIDIFVKKVNDSFSQNKYFKKINWDLSLLISKIVNNQKIDKSKK